ncbi:P4Hc [Seminavis robusta]|uniref:P4Hc n=1 Tax=Seminavis robusta TaxID=568900 RepID=A0A9N8HIF8_9STRA|nr:P4Hc [Seminavis robusta]|eukprot:Sro498_g154880.1 P4Hc (542) ;mRNA; f:7757-9382
MRMVWTSSSELILLLVSSVLLRGQRLCHGWTVPLRTYRYKPLGRYGVPTPQARHPPKSDDWEDAGCDSEILERVESLNADDVRTARESSLVFEDSGGKSGILEEDDDGELPPFEWVDNHVAIRTLEPVLLREETNSIQRAAETLWESQDGSSSRFSYQYATNSEAHVSDFPSDSDATLAINRALLTKIYPLIRRAFPTISPPKDVPLFVYDALVIRYNATKSGDSNQTPRAGQPLHRDLGLVSVNVMLNDATDFEGGGTFFENQLKNHLNQGAADAFNTSSNLLQHKPQPIKPPGVGHCLLHESAERHAGAATVAGIRDILVLFVTAPSSPKIVNARIKQCREFCEQLHQDNEIQALECRIRHHNMALRLVPNDGEAYQYLGTAWMEFAALAKANNDGMHHQHHYLQQAIDCLQRAAVLTPCDSRVYNNLGIALGQQVEPLKEASFAIQTSKEAYRRGHTLLLALAQAGCDVVDETDTLSRNYGLMLANQDRFTEACEVLKDTAARYLEAEKKDGKAPPRGIVEAYQLWKFCQSRSFHVAS